MKVTLVIPPLGRTLDAFSRRYVFPPLGVAYLAAVLEQNDIEVTIIDAYVERYSFRQLMKRFLSDKAEIIGISFATENRFEAFQTARIVKEVLPEAMVVAGGPHVTLATEDTLLHIPEIDIVVRGEGEYTLLDLVNHVKNQQDLKSVLGISYRRGKEIIHNPPRPFIRNLDELPFPARHLMPMDKYTGILDVQGKDRIPADSIITSRGCPFNCNFCASTRMWGYSFRARSPMNAIAEMELIIEKYKRRGFWFFDDTFTMNRQRVAELCQLIRERGLDIKWIVQARVDTVNKELLKAMKEAGCIQVRIGVESGSQRILDSVVGKKINLDQVMRVASWCKEIEIDTKASFIISHPDETIEDALETMKLIHELTETFQIECGLNPLRIYPGTIVEDIAKKKGFLLNDFTWTREMNFSALLPTVVGNVPLFIDKLSWEQLSEFLFEWADLHGYPVMKETIRALKSIRSVKDLKRYLLMLKAFLRRKIKGR